MAVIQLSESGDVVLDAAGAGTVKIGPYGPGEVWSPSSVSVLCSSNAAEAVCKVYVGPSASGRYFKDLTVNGSTGDSTSRCNLPVSKGSFIWAVWSGGDPGAVATVNVDGTKTGA